MRTGAPVRDDRGSQPGHPRLGELLSEGECPNPVPPTRRLDRATPALLHRPAMAELGVAALSHVPSGERVRTGSADPSGAWDQDHPPSTATTTQESGLRENRTSRLSERTEEGRKPDLLRLYTPRAGKPSTRGRAAGVLRPGRGGTRDAKRRNRSGDHPHCGGHWRAGCSERRTPGSGRGGWKSAHVATRQPPTPH